MLRCSRKESSHVARRKEHVTQHPLAAYNVVASHEQLIASRFFKVPLRRDAAIVEQVFTQGIDPNTTGNVSLFPFWFLSLSAPKTELAVFEDQMSQLC